MIVDQQFLINTIAGVVLTIMGWFARVLWEAVKKLQEDLHQLEIELPSNYVRKDEFSDNMREIKDMLGKIFDRLDNKVDKP
jgi:hypothetical protein